MTTPAEDLAELAVADVVTIRLAGRVRSFTDGSAWQGGAIGKSPKEKRGGNVNARTCGPWAFASAYGHHAVLPGVLFSRVRPGGWLSHFGSRADVAFSKKAPAGLMRLTRRGLSWMPRPVSEITAGLATPRGGKTAEITPSAKGNQ